MLTIRNSQMEAFASAASGPFEDRVLAFLQQHFPKKCAAKGKTTVRDEIQHGVKQAREYELDTEIDTVRYILVAFVLHRDFDSDPAIPWAKSILRDTNAPNWLRCERLHRHTMKYLREHEGETVE